MPLVITMALVTSQVERSARAEAFSRTRVIAETLALGISDYVDLHRAAVAALAAQPGLLDADPETQHGILRAFAETYPDALTFVLYDADGQPIARGDDAPIQTPSAVRSPLFDEVRQSGATDVRVVVSPVLGQPIVALGLPIHDANGGFAGVVAVILESTRLADVAQRAATEPGGQVWVVDRRSRLIAASGEAVPAPMSDVSSQPAVARARRQRGVRLAQLRRHRAASAWPASRSCRCCAGAWWWSARRRWRWPARSPPATSRSPSSCVVLATAAALGWLAAAQLAAPLEGLAHAVDALAFGTAPTELPTSGVTEVSRLAAVFGDLRDRLRVRTAERERAERRLRFLADASSHLAASLDYDTTLERVAGWPCRPSRTGASWTCWRTTARSAASRWPTPTRPAPQTRSCCAATRRTVAPRRASPGCSARASRS